MIPAAASITFGASLDSKMTVSNSPENSVRSSLNCLHVSAFDDGSGKLEKIKFYDVAQKNFFCGNEAV